MTSTTAMQNLEAAEARKRKAEEAARDNQKGTTKKKQQQKKNTRRPDKNGTSPSNPRRSARLNSNETDAIDVDMAKDLAREHKTFFTVKLYSKVGIDPVKVLQQTLRDWLKIMQSCVNSIILYEPRQEGDMVLDCPDQITANLQFIRKFFNGVRPRTGAGNIWFTALIGHDEPVHELLENTTWWFQENRSNIYQKKLQVLDTNKELWLLFLHGKMDLTALKEAIDQLIKTKKWDFVPFALTYTNIRDGKNFKSKSSNDKAVKAVHVEVATCDAERIKLLFSKIYGSTVNSFPLQMRMRYVLSVKPNTNSKTKAQILKLRNKQDWFLGSITHAQSWDIQTLDDVTTPNTKSLRTFLMHIKTMDKASTLYLGINEDYRSDGHFFTFPSTLETEARDMISHFGSYIAHEHKTDALIYLRPEAAKRAETSTWDPIKREATSEDNKVMDLLVDKTDKMDWLQDPEKKKRSTIPQHSTPSSKTYLVCSTRTRFCTRYNFCRNI